MKPTSLEEFQLVTERQLVKRSSISSSTWKRDRAAGHLIQGLHWTKKGKRVLYNWLLIKDWLINGESDPVAHQRAIENFQASLLSNQKRKGGRK